MKVMTRIEINTSFYKTDNVDETATFHCCPATNEKDEDEITINFFTEEATEKVEKYSLTLTPEQCEEFIWALQKMISIGKEYREEGK
jgi:hypothetical protein